MGSLAEKIANSDFAFIAEIGVNYYDVALQRGIDLLSAAKLMCDEAKMAGADAVKFQSYKAETLAIKDSPAYWDTSEETTSTQFDLFSKYDHFGAEEYWELTQYCDSINLEFCSTPFDYDSADYLDRMMDVYKVSSSDLTNLPFIHHIASKQKPMIVSVGAANLDEIEDAVHIIREVNEAPLALLHCVLEYPTPYEDANLLRIQTLKSTFPSLTIGYSDHCRPNRDYDVVKTAYCLGARIIEKHFTLDKTLPGNDHYHAADPEDVRGIVSGVRVINRLFGKPELTSLASEAAARENARRSIVAARPILAGSIIDEDDITCKRPGTGISPSKISKIIGRTAVVDISADAQIGFDMVE